MAASANAPGAARGTDAAGVADRGGIALFRVGGIRVRADYSWLFIFFLVLFSLASGYFPQKHPGEAAVGYVLAALLTTLLFFGGLLLHELAHAWMAKRSGIEVPRITLFLFGGVSEMKHEPETPTAELRIAIVGPLMSFALAVVFWVVARVMPGEPWYLSAVPRYLAWINLALAVFNLLPGYPLDGGRVLRAIAWRRTGSLRRATRIAAGAGKAFGIGLMVLGAVEIFFGGLFGGFWLILVGLFLRNAASQEYEALLLRRALADATVAEVMTPAEDVVVVRPDLTLRELVDGYLLDRGYRGFPVADDGHPIGIIRLDDVRKRERASWDGTRVRDAMQPVSHANTIAPAAPLADAMRKMAGNQDGRLLVMDDGRLVGWLTSRDLTRFIELRSLRERE